MKRLVFDLDGTLLDVRRRHYEVYTICLREFAVPSLDYGEYWARRRSGEGTAQIAAASPGVDKAHFQDLWIERIEERETLRIDTLYPGALGLLRGLRGRYELVIATLRRDRSALLAQLRWLGIDCYFHHVLTPVGDVHSGAKLPMVQPLGVNGGTMVIGDSEADVVLAQGLDAELVCVTNGVRDERFLRAAGATWLVAGVSELTRVLRA